MALKTNDLQLGKWYRHAKTGEFVRLVTIDKTGFKRHSTVRLVVEQNNGLRMILRSPSLLVPIYGAAEAKEST